MLTTASEPSLSSDVGKRMSAAVTDSILLSINLTEQNRKQRHITPSYANNVHTNAYFWALSSQVQSKVQRRAVGKRSNEILVITCTGPIQITDFAVTTALVIGK